MAGSNRRLLASSLLGALIGIGVAAGAALWEHASRHQDSDLHQMLHRAVPLDADEQVALDAKERAFAARRVQIEEQLRRANAELAQAIASDPRWTPQVESASRQVENAAAELQRATLEHIFEMRAGLAPEHRAAYDKVLIGALRRGSR